MMKMKIGKSLSYFFIGILGLSLALTSCSKNPEPMQLPPASALSIDLNDFPSNNGTKASDAVLTNFGYAATTVVVWNVVLAVNVAIPVAAYAEAFNHTPVYLEDYTWEWSYDVKVNGITYSASLIGSRIDNETFSMEMSLSKENGFQDFVWFTGVSRYDHTEATWTLSHSPENPVEYLQVEYNKDFETEIADITYTVIDPQNNLYNGYIEYGVDPSLDFDAHYTIFTNDNTTYIEWNRDTNAGRVMDANHFQDQLWHCWDSGLFDVTCPAE